MSKNKNMKKPAKHPQLDMAIFELPCRKATDILKCDYFPEKLLKVLKECNITDLCEAVYLARTDMLKYFVPKRKACAEIKEFFQTWNYLRKDLTDKAFKYAKLLRDAKVEWGKDYVCDLSEISSNAEYEDCTVPDYDKRKMVDLMIKNRLPADYQKIVRMYYGLDSDEKKTPSIRTIAREFKDAEIDLELAKKFPIAAEIRARRKSKVKVVETRLRMSLKLLSDNRDDKNEFVQKKATELLATTQEKEYDINAISDLTGELLRTIRMKSI